MRAIYILGGMSFAYALNIVKQKSTPIQIAGVAAR